MPLIPIAIPVQQPRMMFFDADGKPLVGGKVYSLKIGTDLFKPTFCNANHTALNQNPIILDEAGSALIYMTGNHLLKIYDKFDNFVEMRFLPVTQMRTYFYDKLGKPLKYGRVETYDIASTITKTSYTSSEQTVTNPNPVILDENGSAIICIVGSYRLRVYDSNDVFLWDQDYQRTPAFALTSKPYPLYLDESILTGFLVKDPLLADALQLTENIGTSFVIENAQYISEITYLSYSTEAESVQSSFSVGDAQYVSGTSYKNISDEVFVSTAFSVKNAEIRDIRIEHNAGNESVKTLFSVGNAQYMQEN